MRRKAAGMGAPVNRARRAGPMKLYLLRHPEYGETTANGRTKYEAVIAVARKWGTRWTKLAREAEFIELCDETMIPNGEAEEKIQEIDAVISQLGEAERDIIRLWYIEGKSREETAAALAYVSTKSIYDLRNKAVAEFALRYFGAGALSSV